jgi:hypothetical protein
MFAVVLYGCETWPLTYTRTKGGATDASALDVIGIWGANSSYLSRFVLNFL